MDETIYNGTFRRPERFEVKGTAFGNMSMETVLMLLNICEHLKAVGRLGTWRLFTSGNISELETKVRLKIFELTVT